MRHARIALLVVAFGFSFAGGCKNREASKNDSKESMAADPMKAVKEGPGAPTKPAETAADAPKTMTGKDGAITVTVPTGEGWECVEQQAPMPGTDKQASLVKCRRADRDAEFFFLLAKVYGIPASEVKPAKELATQVFMATYQKLFQNHKIVKEGVVKFGALEGYEVVMEMSHESMGPIKKIERVFTKGENVFLLSGEGKPEMVEKFSKATESWFAQTRFKALEK